MVFVWHNRYKNGPQMFHNMRGPTLLSDCRSILPEHMRVWSLSHYIIPHLETFSHKKSEIFVCPFFVWEKIGFARIYFWFWVWVKQTLHSPFDFLGIIYKNPRPLCINLTFWLFCMYGGECISYIWLFGCGMFLPFLVNFFHSFSLVLWAWESQSSFRLVVIYRVKFWSLFILFV